MSYLAVVNIIKNISEDINPTGYYSHSDKWKASLNFDQVDKQIVLYPIEASMGLKNSFYETWSISMGFYFQDAPDSTALEQQGLIAQADSMVTEFLAVINQVQNVVVANSRKLSTYRDMAGTYTGMFLRFNFGIAVNICNPAIIYPDIPNYPQLKQTYNFIIYGNGTNTITIPALVGKTLLALSTDNSVRNFNPAFPPNDATFTSATGTIEFESVVESYQVIQGLYQ